MDKCKFSGEDKGICAAEELSNECSCFFENTFIGKK